MQSIASLIVDPAAYQAFRFYQIDT